MIEIKGLSKSYGLVNALDNIDLNIDKGEIIGLFGENGAGKTTLMKAIFGFIKYSGKITIDGEKVGKSNLSQLAFASCEHTFFPDLTADEHVEFYKEYFPKFKEKRYKGLMEFFGLPHNMRIKNMSVGQQNQFETILALSQGANYIFLDEPFTGNDIFNREDFYKVLLGILEDDETIFLSTHLIEEVSGFIGRAVLIKKGKIIADQDVLELEEEGMGLVDFIKKKYNYQSDRVAHAIDSM